MLIHFSLSPGLSLFAASSVPPFEVLNLGIINTPTEWEYSAIANRDSSSWGYPLSIPWEMENTPEIVVFVSKARPAPPWQHQRCSALLQLPTGVTGLYWVLLGVTGGYWGSLGFTGCYWGSLGSVGQHLRSQERCFRTARNDEARAFTPPPPEMSLSFRGDVSGKRASC